MKFNSKDWNEREDLFYSKRKFVVNDLITNHLKVGMRYDEIIRLLGKPSYESIQENSEIHYEILEKYGWNIDQKKYNIWILNLIRIQLLQVQILE